MFTPNIYLFLLALFYAVVLQILSLILLQKKISIKPKRPLLFIFLLAFLIRFIPAVFFPFGSGYDVSSLRWTAGRVYEGSDIYYSLRFRHHHPYFPAFGILLSFLLKISDQTKIPFLVLMKLPTIFFDSLIPVMIFLINKKFNQTLVYLLSPISIIIGAYIGQFDSIPLLLLILSFYLFTLKKELISALILGLGLVVKPWILLFLPPILMKSRTFKRNSTMVLFFLLPLVLILLLYKKIIPEGNLIVMFLGIALYDSGVGWWGFSAIIQKLTQILHLSFINLIFSQLFKIITVSLIAVNYLFSGKINIFYFAKLTILIIYVFSFGLGGNYLLWILPFALITNDKLFKPYLLLTGSYLILFGILGGLDLNFQPPFTPPIFNKPYMFFLWTFFLFWGAKELRKILRAYIYSAVL